MRSIGETTIQSSRLIDDMEYEITLSCGRSEKELDALLLEFGNKYSNVFFCMTEFSGSVDAIVRGPSIVKDVGLFTPTVDIAESGKRINCSCDLYVVESQWIIAVISPKVQPIRGDHVRLYDKFTDLDAIEYVFPGTQLIEVGQFSEKLIRIPSFSGLGISSQKFYAFPSEIHEELVKILAEVEKHL